MLWKRNADVDDPFADLPVAPSGRGPGKHQVGLPDTLPPIAAATRPAAPAPQAAAAAPVAPAALSESPQNARRTLGIKPSGGPSLAKRSPTVSPAAAAVAAAAAPVAAPPASPAAAPRATVAPPMAADPGDAPLEELGGDPLAGFAGAPRVRRRGMSTTTKLVIGLHAVVIGGVLALSLLPRSAQQDRTAGSPGFVPGKPLPVANGGEVGSVNTAAVDFAAAEKGTASTRTAAPTPVKPASATSTASPGTGTKPAAAAATGGVVAPVMPGEGAAPATAAGTATPAAAAEPPAPVFDPGLPRRKPTPPPVQAQAPAEASATASVAAEKTLTPVPAATFPGTDTPLPPPAPRPEQPSFDNLVNSLSGSPAPTPAAAPSTGTGLVPPMAGTASLAGNTALSRAEIAQVAQQVAPCLVLPASAGELGDTTIPIALQLSPDGTVARAGLAESGKNRYLSDSLYRDTVDSAVQAMQDPACQPFHLPPAKYASWKQLTLTFNPKDVR